MDKNTRSFWTITAPVRACPALGRDIETDVLVIGGGITGITCAYCLARKNIRTAVVEAGDLCGGTTGNTTGKLTIGHGLIYGKILKKYGREAAGQYAESQSAAIDFVRCTVENEGIDCQFAPDCAYIYASSEGEREAVLREYDALARLGIRAELTRHPVFPPKNSVMIGYPDQAVFHPVRYVEALSERALEMKAEIFCHTKAVDLEEDGQTTVICENGGRIRCNHVVMATQYPIFEASRLFFTRLYAKRTYGIAVLPQRDWPDGSYINAGDPVRSVRSHMENGNRVLIVAGDGHPTGRGVSDMEEHFDHLSRFADGIAGIRTLLARWSAQDYETPDQIPYIGRISEKPDLYMAAGFGKWGLSSGTLAGQMIADLIENGRCRYEQLYSISRGDFLTSPGKATAEILGAAGAFVKSKLEKTEDLKDLQRGEGRTIVFRGKKAGVYRSDDDEVTVLDITCTHMRTELHFNSAEKTWDCPAHGGRFDTDGKRLEGPPKKPLEILYKGTYSSFTDGT